MQLRNVKAMLTTTNGTSEERQFSAHREQDIWKHGRQPQWSCAERSLFLFEGGLKPGPQGARGRQIRAFLSAHKRMRIYTRKCLSLCQIGFRSVPPEVGVVPRLRSKVVPVQVLKEYWEVEV